MPLKTLKKDTAKALTLEWVLHVKNYRLNLDKDRCVGCQICSLACPKEAISVQKYPKKTGEKAKKAKVDIDLAKCNFCGICDLMCPYGAIKVTINGEHALSVIEKESFPQLVRDIRFDGSRVPKGYAEYEETCPLNLIKVSWMAADGKSVENAGALSKAKKKRLEATIEVEKDYCPCCRVCEFKLPEGAMRIRKFIYGKIDIHPEKCPAGCTDCLDVCPITGALYYSEDDKKVHVNEVFCVYCGACKAVCPVPEALDLKRTQISHTSTRSGTWNKALERLASPVEISKELKAKGSHRAVDSVVRLQGLKREKGEQRRT